MQDKDDHRDNEDEMNQGAADVKSESEYPKQNEDKRDNGKHEWNGTP
jgi:hypothetical protein